MVGGMSGGNQATSASGAIGVFVSAIIDAASAAAGPSSVAIMAWRSMARLPLYGAGASQSVGGGGAAAYRAYDYRSKTRRPRRRRDLALPRLRPRRLNAFKRTFFALRRVPQCELFAWQSWPV